MKINILFGFILVSLLIIGMVSAVSFTSINESLNETINNITNGSFIEKVVDFVLGNNSDENISIKTFGEELEEENETRIPGKKFISENLNLSKKGIIVNRSAYSDTYLLDDGTYVAQIFASQINIKDLNGTFKPYEEVTQFFEDENGLVLKWNNKKVRLNYEIKEKGELNYEKLKEKYNIKTRIEKRRGSYYFDHTLNGNELEEFNYKIETIGVDCSFRDYKLICDEQVIDFGQAVREQNLSVEKEREKIKIKGNDLSYIDPSVKILDINNGLSQYDSVRLDCDGGDFSYYDYDLTPIGTTDSGNGKIYHSYLVFGLSSSGILDGATIYNVSLKYYLDYVDESDCTEVDLDFYGVNGSNFNLIPSRDSEIEDIFEGLDDGINYLSLSYESSDDGKWYEVDLGIYAYSDFADLLEDINHNQFVIGLVGEGGQSCQDYDDSDCNLDLGDVSPYLPFLSIKYQNPDTTAPTTSATAKTIPNNQAYDFNTTTPYNVQVTLSCYDTGGSGCMTGYPKYCIDTTNTCTPTTSGTSVTISTEGINYIRYYSEDNWGNIESTKSNIIDISRIYDSLQLNILGINVWNQSDNYFSTETISNLNNEINSYLEICEEDKEGYCLIPISIYSKTNKTIKLKNVNIDYNISKYVWDLSGLQNSSQYKVRIKANDGIQNSSWSESRLFSIGSYALPNDTNKFYVNNDNSEAVAWIGDSGNIVLAGECFISPNCDNPADGSLIFKDYNETTVGYIDSFGNLCAENGNCAGHESNCNPNSNAFIVKNTLGENMSYISFNGELCVTGGIYENVEFF
ncbi:hypothetical protein GW932_05195 [archaeon]|nr:hypothetical protein [archaeon]